MPPARAGNIADNIAGNILEHARYIMEAHWLEGDGTAEADETAAVGSSAKTAPQCFASWGYSCPNPQHYGWQWLWDSCFHAIIWAELGEGERALLELGTLLSTIEPSGFVPHMNFVSDPAASLKFWRRRGTSSITQPPMFGHAIAELVRRGVGVPKELMAQAAAGLRFFAERRLDSASGLVRIVHPWESGADNSPRWDGFYSEPFPVSAGSESLSQTAWQHEKVALLGAVERDGDGVPLSNPAFDVSSAYFTALVAFNILELASATGCVDPSAADGMVEAVRNAWSDEHKTWVDVAGGASRATATATATATTTAIATTTATGGPEILSAPVLDALLCLLVDDDETRADAVCRQLFDPDIFGAPFGPAGVSKQHPGYDGDGYWRGAAWPQISYLMCVALRRRNRLAEADAVAEQLRQGAERSGFAEHWNPDTGKAGGAMPQSWSALCAVV